MIAVTIVVCDCGTRFTGPIAHETVKCPECGSPFEMDKIIEWDEDDFDDEYVPPPDD